MKKFIIHGNSVQLYAGTISQAQYNYWSTKAISELMENLTCESSGCQQAGNNNLGGNLKKISNLCHARYVLADNAQIISEEYDVKSIFDLSVVDEKLNIPLDSYYFLFSISGQAVYEFKVDRDVIDYDKLVVNSDTISDIRVIKGIKYEEENLILSEMSINYVASDIKLMAST